MPDFIRHPPCCRTSACETKEVAPDQSPG